MSTSALSIVSPPISVSRMTEHDLLEVVEIEQSCGLSRWGWDAYHNEMLNGDRNLMLVARLEAAASDGKSIAGYLVGRLGAGELHINNVAVREPYRRCGIGAALVRRILNEARTAGAFVVFLEVRAGNAAAHGLYESCGFRIVGRRKKYYAEPLEDALTMSLELAP